jgi:hypothetical protein
MRIAPVVAHKACSPYIHVTSTCLHYSLRPGTTSDTCKPVTTGQADYQEIQLLEIADLHLKHRIRVLKLVSRVVALALSLTTLIPLAMTVVKFLSTKDTYFTINGMVRTAWAHDSITWYTYMYFTVSLISFVFDLGVVVTYWCGTEKANEAASIASWWTATLMASYLSLWIVSTALYRHSRVPLRGISRDL